MIRIGVKSISWRPKVNLSLLCDHFGAIALCHWSSFEMPQSFYAAHCECIEDELWPKLDLLSTSRAQV